MPRHARRVRPSVTAALVVLLGLAVGGCAGASIPLVSFDPSSACTTDGRMPGAYPELEALLPAEYQGAAPVSVDSGRSCTAEALGSLAADGVHELRFAGTTWDLGGTSGLTVAVFQADGLTPDAMIGFYRAGAAANDKTEKLQTSDATVAGKPARRLDVLQSDGSGHTIVAWAADEPGLVHVLLASDLGDARVLQALEEFGAR
jgi:hypothetical protein